MNTFMKKLFGFSIGPIVGALISFVTTPLLTNNIIPAEYGKASIFLTLYIWVQSFILLGMDQAYTREFNEYQNKKKLFQNAMLVPLVLSLMIGLIVILFPDFFAYILYNDSNEVLPTVAFGLLIFFIVIERFLLLYIRMQEKAFEYSIFNVVMKASILIVTVLLLVSNNFSFHVIVYSQVFGQIFADLYLIIRYRKLLNFTKLQVDTVLIKKMLNFGLPIMISAIVFSSLNSLDRFFLRIYSNAESLGIYQATLKIAGVIQIVKTAFTSFWIPTAYRWYSEKKPMINFQFISELIMFIMTIIFFVIIIFKEVIVFILGSEYNDAVYLIGLMVLPQLLYTASETTTLGIVFSRRSRLNILVSVFSIIPSVILNIILTPLLGGIGAAISSAIGFLFFFILRTYFSNRTGFYFPMKYQYMAVAIMFICALSNAFINVPTWFNLITFVLCIFIQKKFLYKLKHLYKDTSYIDFT